MRRRIFRHRSTIKFISPAGNTVYLRPNRNNWDASWYTTDINKAKVWRIRGMAEAWLRGRGEDIKLMSPEIIDPRTVLNYKDKGVRL